jgi:hypothetical protein
MKKIDCCWTKNYTNLLEHIFRGKKILTKGIDDLWAANLIDIKHIRKRMKNIFIC